MSAASNPVEFDNVNQLVAALGGIDGGRIKLRPAPGTATEKDLVRQNDRKERLYELVDGTLVEKPMGWEESKLGIRLGRLLGNYIEEHDLGDLGGADGGMRLVPGQVRLPDLSFIEKRRLPAAGTPEAVCSLFPDLAVEILSEGNTPAEMERKRKEYFFAGTRLVWEVDPRRREIDVYTDPETRTTLTEADTLDGGTVLPGFTLRVAEVFARVPRAPKPRRGRK
jgi:Uma2 family endonuclease